MCEGKQKKINKQNKQTKKTKNKKQKKKKKQKQKTNRKKKQKANYEDHIQMMVLTGQAAVRRGPWARPYRVRSSKPDTSQSQALFAPALNTQ